MKLLKTIPLVFCSLMFGQKKENYFSASLGSDIKNSIVGSKPTGFKPASDLVIGLHVVSNNFELNPEIETFSKIGYFRSGINFGLHFNKWFIPIGNTEMDFTLVPSIGASLISRSGKEDKLIVTPEQDYWVYGNSSHISAQANLSFRLKLSDSFILDYTANLSTRPDLVYMYPTDNPKFMCLSNFLKLHYIIKNN